MCLVLKIWVEWSRKLWITDYHVKPRNLIQITTNCAQIHNFPIPLQVHFLKYKSGFKWEAVGGSGERAWLDNVPQEYLIP